MVDWARDPKNPNKVPGYSETVANVVIQTQRLGMPQDMYIEKKIKPFFFETTLGNRKGDLVCAVDNYKTSKDAVLGHEGWVQTIKSELNDDSHAIFYDIYTQDPAIMIDGSLYDLENLEDLDDD